MVRAIHQRCDQCDAFTMHHDGGCVVCAERERRVERAKWLALTDNEKIEVLLKRIEVLERGPTRY